MTWLAMQLDGWLLDDWMVGWLDASLFDDEEKVGWCGCQTVECVSCKRLDGWIKKNSLQ